MNLIVAVDENWGIGYKGDLLVKIREDLKYFKRMTVGKIVVMGRVTFESLPGQQPLKDRTNVILTKDKSYINFDAFVCHNEDNVFEICKDRETFIIGGEQIYVLFLPYITKAYITQIYHSFEADKFLPRFVEGEDWKLIEESEVFYTEEGIKYQFLVYEK